LITATPDEAVEARLTLAFIQPAAGDTGSIFIDSVSLVSSLVGDYNGDGQVEQADLNLVLGNWGRDTSKQSIPGWNNDLPAGFVDQSELNAVLNYWGSASAPNLSLSSIPEPASVLTFAIAASCFPRRR